MATAYYLPAGTEVVILRNGTHTWYTTKDRVSVESWATAPCPVRSGVTVLTAEIKGFRIWFLENQMCVELSEGMKNLIQNVKLSKLEYDIPAVVSRRPQDYLDKHGNSFRHPSTYMWNYGVRTTRSMWLVREERIPWSAMHNLTRQGCTWDVTPIDHKAAAKLLSQSVVSLRREWIELHQSRENCLRTAAERRDAKLAEATGHAETEKANRQYRYDVKRVEKDFKEGCENVRKGATSYGIPLDWVTGKVSVLDRPSVTNAIVGGPVRTAEVAAANRAVAHNRAAAHVAAVDSLNRAGAVAVAASVEAGDMPHDVAADYMDDNDVKAEDENGTYDLRKAFSDESDEE